MWDFFTNAGGWFFGRIGTIGHVLLWRVLTAFGIGIGTYTFLLPEMVQFVQQYLVGLPDWAMQMLGALHVDDGLTMLFSAYAAKLGIRVQAIKLDGSGSNP